MRTQRSFAFALLGASLVTLFSAPVLAQHGAHASPTTADTQAAQVGVVSFTNSGAPAAQADFLYGLAQLHNFEYEDAAAAFARAREADPSFAMAVWGEAMTFNHPIWQEQDLEKGLAALAKLGAGPQHVVRTRMFVTDISRWQEFGRAHGEVFREHPPATTMVEVRALIDPEMLIEIEVDAIVDSE